MKKLLKFILVLQEVDNRKRENEKRLGRGFMYARRFNPYNPLTYVVFVFAFLIGIIMFGVVGVWKEIDRSNPFKWN